MNHHQWDDAHALSGAYAVDALDAEERARFESHLENCQHCRDEVDGLRDAAAALGSSQPTEPPSSVRDAVLAGITGIRPLPPVTAEPVPVPDTPPSPAADLSARRRLRQLRRVPLLVAAAVILIATAGLAVWSPWSAPDDEKVHLSVTERVLTADDAARVEAAFDDGSRATVVISRSVGRAVILTEDMAQPPDGRVYALWLQSPAGVMVPAGLMPDDPDATVPLDGDASRATAVGITIEPDGGSPEPTSEPIAVFPLEA
ncbi:anti-sigma factor domain-containing protein [Nocardioides caeni]|uniref:Regulator of SigK n=1 Tax=Nocardioides caeni TaxID=574700 RepID=A0A4S8N074_9ACTN|nr:anti-sigma factor [Nocardioides caeni]THV09160.1 anti-sigma factor [Nocardioides caeni]